MKVRGTTVGTPFGAKLTALCWGAMTLLAPVAGSAHPSDVYTSRVPSRSSQASTRSVSSALAHGVGPGPGRTVSALASSTSITGRGWVPGGDTPAATSRPCRTTASSLCATARRSSRT